MLNIMKLLGFLFVFMLMWCNVQSRCKMRGHCSYVNGFPRNCVYDGEPLPILAGLSPELRENVIANLKSRCPYIIFDEEGNQKPDDEILTCCNHEQVQSLSEGLLLSEGVLGRCPVCSRNFARQICEMNCSPDQASFIDVYSETTIDGLESVYEVDYRMYEQFMNSAYDSCSGVLVPQTGMPAINLMCGDAPVCDAEAWFGFTGNVTVNHLTETQVNFLKWPTEEGSMHAYAPHCNDTLYDDLPCSCVDCFDVCPTGSEPEVREICTVLNIHCASFSVSIFVIVVTIVVVVILSRKDYVKVKTLKDETGTKPTLPNKKRKINKTIQAFQIMFTEIGSFSANNSLLMIMMTSWIGFAMFFGFLKLNISSDPIELWSEPDSRSRTELNYFNERFGPFYRTSQVYLQFTGLTSFIVNNQTFGPAFRLEAMEELIKLEDLILNIGRDDGGVVLEEVCYAPLRPRGTEQRVDQCVSMSVSTYLGDDRNNINNNTYLNLIQNCLNNYLSLGCTASWGGGAEPDLALGGFDGDYLTADTLLINFPLTGQSLEENLRRTLEWEASFLDLMYYYEENLKPDFVKVAYAAERSVEDEIQRVSALEAIPVVISYILMFIYVTMSLGNVRSCKTWFIESKIMVAISSIIIVLLSIFCALGVMGYMGITITLLAINVVPFFVLSVGIDNVFLMVNTLYDLEYKLKEFEDYNENFSFNRKRAFIFKKMLCKVGPSMFVSSITQITCFGIGCIAKFPAVKTFSAFLTIALAFLFLFQITTVIAILAIDYKRTSQNRFDVLCCIQKKILNDDDPLNSDTPYRSVITSLMEPYSKFLLQWWVKLVVVLVFAGFFATCIMMIPQIEIGLDQEMALPKDSYVYTYLEAVRDLLRIGPPVFFVLKSGLNFSDPVHQNTICGGILCNEDSLNTQIFLAARHSEITYISQNSNSWLDDFFDWTNLYGACCKYNSTDGGFCQSLDNSPECLYCDISRGEWQNGLRPTGEAFERYIPFFLQDSPSDICNRGGLASYSTHVNYVLDSEGRATVQDSAFMAYHRSVSSSFDYITAVKYGYEISESITKSIKEHTGTDVEVFPYSIFYVFFEQYLTMWTDTFLSILYCCIGAAILNFVASGFNWLTTSALMCTVVMVVLDMMGIMYFWNIPLNAVSTINLIVSIGITVEFCGHIAYAFAVSPCPKEERIADALKTVGATIITGITFTNIPIIILAFSYTEIIEVFFFRMNISLVVLGLLHGMVFFPVLLSYLSGINFKNKKGNTITLK